MIPLLRIAARGGPYLASLATLCACTHAPALSPPPPEPPASITPPPSAEAWRADVPAAGEPGRLDFPAVAPVVLANGLTLLACQRSLPVVTIAAAVRHGATSVDPGKTGLAALTARMLLESTRERSSDALAEAAEDLGSTLEADAGRDHSIVELTVLPGDLPQGLELVSEALRRPAFTREDFGRVRAESLSSLAAQRQHPSRLASLAALRLLAGPLLGAPVGGAIADVERLTTTDATDFHTRHYRPDATALILVGDVTPATAETLVQEHFGAWTAPGGPPPPPPPAKPPAPGPRVLLVDRPQVVQSAIFIALPLPPRQAPDHESRLVMNHVVGGLFTSRLNQSLREEHALTYGASSSVLATRTWGAWVAATSVETAATAQALREIRRELTAVASTPVTAPLTEFEVERAKAALIHEQAALLADARELARELASAYVLGLPADHPAHFAERVRQVTRDDAARAATAYLSPDPLIVVVVGDRGRFEGQLRAEWSIVESAHPALLE